MILEQLFSSKVRAKLLTAFFTSPNARYHAWELAQTLGETYSAVWKELARLEEAGFLLSEQKPNAKLYSANPQNPIYPELRSIIIKTAGVGDVIRTAFTGNEKIKAVFIYGSFASGEADERSDLDLMVIGEVDLPRFASVVVQLEKNLRRPVNYVIFTEEEWKMKIKNGDPFALNVKEAPKIILIGGENAI